MWLEARHAYRYLTGAAVTCLLSTDVALQQQRFTTVSIRVSHRPSWEGGPGAGEANTALAAPSPDPLVLPICCCCCCCCCCSLAVSRSISSCNGASSLRSIRLNSCRDTHHQTRFISTCVGSNSCPCDTDQVKLFLRHTHRVELLPETRIRFNSCQGDTRQA